MLIDSHCHLQSLEPGERRAALDRARARGVEGFLVPAIRLDDAEELLRLAREEENLWCALGVHPHEAASWREGDQERLAGLLEEPGVVAVGECGLDFHYDNAPRDTQLRVLRAQCEVALDSGLPVVIHNRESNATMLEVFADRALEGLMADFHSFAGGRAMAEALLPKGHSFGFSGMVTFRAADNVREVLPLVPPGRYLVETDTPYLAPVPYRGKPNEPAYVVEVAQRVAEERGISWETLLEETSEAFFGLFPRSTAAREDQPRLPPTGDRLPRPKSPE